MAFDYGKRELISRARVGIPGFRQIGKSSSGAMSGNENKVVLNLSSECLKKIANDPEFTKKVEFNLTGAVQGQNNMFAQAKADNAIIHGVTAVMDADGNVSVNCGGMTRTSGTKQN